MTEKVRIVVIRPGISGGDEPIKGEPLGAVGVLTPANDGTRVIFARETRLLTTPGSRVSIEVCNTENVPGTPCRN